jgi:hypothetical protein
VFHQLVHKQYSVVVKGHFVRGAGAVTEWPGAAPGGYTMVNAGGGEELKKAWRPDWKATAE